MADNKDCKGCSATVHHSFEEVKSNIADYIKTIDPDYRTTSELYEKRLAQCSSCVGLYYQSTCRYCGCFVQMRALRTGVDCPNPNGSKWYGLDTK